MVSSTSWSTPTTRLQLPQKGSEYTEASKITFHADRNCMLDNRKLGECMRGKHMGGPGPSNCNTSLGFTVGVTL